MSNKEESKQKFSVSPIKLWRDVKDTVLMFWSAVRGKFPFPKRSFLWLIFFLVYAIIPFDLIPDPLIAFLGLGAADDLLVLVFVLNKMSPDLEKFRFYKHTGMTKYSKNIVDVEVVKNEKNF